MTDEREVKVTDTVGAGAEEGPRLDEGDDEKVEDDGA